MRFFLGSSEAHWLWDERLAGVDLFVSAIRLRRKKKLKPALTDWALDSGGFSALSKDGKWDTTPEEYAEEVRRYAREIGRMQWAASMDWMCEDQVRELTDARDGFDCYGNEDTLVSRFREGTSITDEYARHVYRVTRIEHIVEEHQRHTVANYLRLCELAPEIPWVPTIQGWGEDADDNESTMMSYSNHVEMYYEAGVELHTLPVVGVGSVCRRQNTEIAGDIIKMLFTSYDLKNLHGFGFKVSGLRAVGHMLASSDSLAWSYAARKRKVRLEGCTHKYCNVCPTWAKLWREDLLDKAAAAAPHAPPSLDLETRPEQTHLTKGGPANDRFDKCSRVHRMCAVHSRRDRQCHIGSPWRSPRRRKRATSRRDSSLTPTTLQCRREESTSCRSGCASRAPPFSLCSLSINATSTGWVFNRSPRRNADVQ